MTKVAPKKISVALAGNPNCGKTTIYNALTGQSEAVGNYSGVTVDVVKAVRQTEDSEVEFVDLPGVYSLTTYSKDEVVARDYLLKERVDVVVNVVDASNLERNLFLTLQILELGLPVVVALNMCDLAAKRGVYFDAKKLSNLLGVPIVDVVGVTGQGLETLLETALSVADTWRVAPQIPESLRNSQEIEKEISLVEAAVDNVAKSSQSDDESDALPASELGVDWLANGAANSAPNTAERGDYASKRTQADVLRRRRWLAVKLLEDDSEVVEAWKAAEISEIVSSSVERLASKDASTPIAALFAAHRYENVRKIAAQAVKSENRSDVLFSDRLDQFLTHPFWGLLVFLFAMYVVFWLTFTIGNYPVEWLESGQNALSEYCERFWADNPDSLIRSLVIDGIIAGVGGVLVFFPNIFILFAAIAMLEESGYMARGAFLTDRFLSKIGLTGKSFIPMLVGFGCSIPAVMSTRIIEDKKSRLATMFIIPLMSCGARYPIYMLIIPAFFPLEWQAPILWIIYVVGIIVAAVLSTVITSKTFHGESEPLLIELPVYHAPTFRTVGAKAFERGWMYIRKAGTTILGVSIVLWALSTFPQLPQKQAEEFENQIAAINQEAGALGVDLDELSATLAAEEEEGAESADEAADESGEASDDAASEAVAPNPSALALLERREAIENAYAEAQLEYSVVGRLGKGMEPVIKYAGFDWRIGSALVGAFAAKEVFVAQMGIVYKVGEVDETSKPLKDILAQKYSPLVAISIIIFCLIGAPCMATLVVVAKESSWKWAFAQWTTLTGLGFILACLAYQIGRHFIGG